MKFVLKIFNQIIFFAAAFKEENSDLVLVIVALVVALLLISSVFILFRKTDIFRFCWTRVQSCIQRIKQGSMTSRKIASLDVVEDQNVKIN